MSRSELPSACSSQPSISCPSCDSFRRFLTDPPPTSTIVSIGYAMLSSYHPYLSIGHVCLCSPVPPIQSTVLAGVECPAAHDRFAYWLPRSREARRTILMKILITNKMLDRPCLLCHLDCSLNSTSSRVAGLRMRLISPKHLSHISTCHPNVHQCFPVLLPLASTPTVWQSDKLAVDHECLHVDIFKFMRSSLEIERNDQIYI